MNNRKLQNKKAFSLIELSIVLLIIGIIIAGITQSTRLIAAFKLSSARSLTQSSPVASMTNLTIWWETTSIASFSEAQADNGITVTKWYDINPTSTYKYDTTGGPGALYTANCANGLPCLRFAGNTTTYFNYDGTFLVNSDFTIIVVEQRRSSGSNYFLAGSIEATNQNMHLGYRNNTTETFALYANDYDVTVTGYSSPIPKIHVYTFNSAVGKTLHLNGALATFLAGSATGTTALSAYPNSRIGYSATNSPVLYNGDICEIIMFNRALKTEERRSIESYLGKKWGITVS